MPVCIDLLSLVHIGHFLEGLRSWIGAMCIIDCSEQTKSFCRIIFHALDTKMT